MKKYTNRLKDLRNDLDMTQTEVSKKFYLQPTQYRRYENGETDLPLEWAKKFAIFYNVSIDYIAGLIETERPLHSTPETLSEKEAILVSQYRKNKKLQEAVDILLGLK